ncbi:hypothetical protein BC830DRAFT_605115 [Chytriomyces sp. MP71]|nr:hypothetical protein BC830DRAFT_605115 [Chytriomyces sp. MP71]
MGAPFSILVTGPKRTGKSQLVDRVFGLSSGDSVASQPVTQIEHFADEEGFIRCVFIGSSGVASYYVRAGGMIEGVVKPPPPFDMAWIFIDGDFGVDEEMCVEATLEKRIPTLICISHADDRQPEDLKAVAAIVKSRVDIILKDLIAQREGDGSLATPAFDVIQVQNPLPPTCMECQSKTLQKRIPDVPTMQAWYCTNPECELCDICPFKATDFVPNQPVFNQELHAKCLGLLHANATVTRRYQIAQLIDSAIKFEYAKTFIITTTLISTGLGASPIPFADAPLLVATQLTLVNSVCSVYGVQNASTYWGLFKNVMATPIVGLAVQIY